MAATVEIDVALVATLGEAKAFVASLQDGGAVAGKLTADIDRLEKAYKSLAAANAGAAKTTAQTTAADTSAAASAAKLDRAKDQLAQSEIRAARAAKDYAGALAIVERELATATPGTVKFNNLIAQQSALMRQAAPGPGALARSVDGLKSSITGLAAGYGILKIATGTVDFLKTGQALNVSRASFDALAKSAGTTGAALLGSLRDAAKGMVTDADLITSANKGILLGGQSLATKLPALLKIAASASAAGLGETGKLFEDLVTGISRGSTQILDNIGLTIKLEDVNKAYAASLHKNVDELSAAEKQQALLNAVLEKGAGFTATLGGATSAGSRSLEELRITYENLKNSLASTAAIGLTDVTSGFTTALRQADVQALQNGVTYQKYTDVLKLVGEDSHALTAEQFALAQRLIATGLSAEEAAAKVRILRELQGQRVAAGDDDYAANTIAIAANTEVLTLQTDASFQAALAAEMHRQAMALLADQTAATTAAATQYHTANQFGTLVLGDTTAATTGLSEAQREQVIKSIEAKDQAYQLADAQAAMERISNLAATGHISHAMALAMLQKQFGFTTADAESLITSLERLNAVSRGEKVGSDALAAGVAAAKKRKAAQDLERELAELQDPRRRTARLRNEAAGDIGDPKTQQARIDLERERQAEAARSAAAGKKATSAAASAAKKEASSAAADAKRAATESAKDSRDQQAELERIKKAQFDLLSNEDKLRSLRTDVASGTLPEDERLVKVKEIRDLEKKIGDERLSAINAALAAERGRIDDRQARLKEDQELRKADQIIASSQTSAAQKEAARLRKEEIAIERQQRQQEIAEKRREAGQAPGALPALPRGVPSPGASGGLGPLPGVGGQPTAPAQLFPLPVQAPRGPHELRAVQLPQVTNTITVVLELDGEVIGRATARHSATASANEFHMSLKGLMSGGFGTGSG